VIPLPGDYDSIWLRALRKVRSLISVITSAKQFQLAQLQDRGLEEGMRSVMGTLGFGHVGERAPVGHQNVSAYTEMLLIKRLWADEYGDETTKKVYDAYLKSLETELFARSHTLKTIVGPVAEAVEELVEAVKRMPFTEESEESGVGEGESST